MLTVTLRSDAASLLLCTVDGPEQVTYDLVADMASRPPGESTEKFRQRLTGALVAASQQVNTYNGLDTGQTTGCYTHVTVGDGDVLTDFAMSVGEFTHDGAIKAWQSRDRGDGGENGGFRDTPGVGQRTSAQVTAERERVAELLREHPTPNGERARIMKQMDENGDATTIAEFDRINGDQWTAERDALHERIILEHLAEATRVPHDHKAVLLGGLPGSGKGGVLKKPEVGIDETKYLRIDPDLIKQELLDKHTVNKPDGMTDGEMAAWLHHESTHITDALQDRAMKLGINVIIDKTMSKSPAGQLGKLDAAGYTVHGVFVDVSVDESLRSADIRWKEGGRFIPPVYIESSRIEGIDARSKNAAAFASAAGLFSDGWQFVTNDGIADRNPQPTFRRGDGKFEFAMAGLTVLRSRPFAFRTLDEVPRDYHGRWTGPGGEGAGEATKGGDVVIADGRVSVSPSAAVDLIENLGTRPTPSDLTKVNITGHPGLFGQVARNTLRRVDMPQVPSDRLDDFAGYLGERGITMNHEHVSPLELKATQNELDGRKTGQMVTAMLRGTMPANDKPVWASQDGYILDGHHRWAAEAVLAAAGIDRPPMTIVRVHTPMTQLIGQARAFNQAEGIDSKLHGMTIRPIGLTHDGAIKAWESRDRGDGGDSGSGGGSFDSDGKARSALEDKVHGLSEFDEETEHDRYQKFDEGQRARRTGPADDFVGDYVDWAYQDVNKALRQGGEAEDWVTESIAGLDKTIADHGSASPAGLLRGKGEGSSLAELGWEVGHEFTDKAYGSWTPDPKVALHFAKDVGKGSVVMRLTNSKGIRSIPGKEAEYESILPHGIKYKVTGISDFVGPDGVTQRLMDVEAVDKSKLAMALHPITFTHEGALKAWESRKRKAEGAAEVDAVAQKNAEPPADPPTTSGLGLDVGNGLPTADQFDAMEKTGGPLGSQGGGWYRDDTGQRYLVKPAQSRTHAMNELTMSVLYDHFGTPVDQTGIFARGDKWYIAKKAIQNPNGKLGKIVGDDVTPDIQSQARQGFGTDALASSWDAYGLVGDNVLTTDGGTLYRIDVGGSGMYRAMGGDKPSFNPGKTWVEPDTLRTSNQGRKLYGDMTDSQAAASLEKLNGYDIDMFDAKLGRMGVDADVRTRTVATIRDRIDNQLPGIIRRLDDSLTAAAWLPTAEFTRAGAIKAWQSRDRGDGGDDQPMLLTAQQFAKLTPAKRTSTPAEWQSSKAEIAACKKLAADKARNVPQPTAERIAKNHAILERAKTKGRAGGELRGNSTTRRERGEALFAEFDQDGNGSCPCNYCGIKVSPKGRDGHAVMQQDKILTAEEGGSYGTPTNFPNLVPACTGCNAHRNDQPYHIRPKWERTRTRALAAAAGEPTADGREVVAFPLGWDDPDLDTLDTPVQGILEVVDVDTPWGPYEQWRVGGEVVDPATVTDP